MENLSKLADLQALCCLGDRGRKKKEAKGHGHAGGKPIFSTTINIVNDDDDDGGEGKEKGGDEGKDEGGGEGGDGGNVDREGGEGEGVEVKVDRDAVVMDLHL